MLVEWEEGSQIVYPAFTPLVEPYRIVRGDADLRFVGEASLPGQGVGRLRLASHANGPVHARLDNQSLDGFPVALGPAFEFSIYPSGHLRLVDATGSHHGIVYDW